MARTSERFCFRYEMSGMTRSTPSNSDSGNIMPASDDEDVVAEPQRIMFMPNSPRPPRGMAVRDCEGLAHMRRHLRDANENRIIGRDR